MRLRNNPLVALSLFFALLFKAQPSLKMMYSPFTFRRVDRNDLRLNDAAHRCKFIFDGDNDFVFTVEYYDDPCMVLITYTMRGKYTYVSRKMFECEYRVLENADKLPSEYTLRNLLTAEALPDHPMCLYLSKIDFQRLGDHVHQENYFDIPISRLPVADFELLRREVRNDKILNPLPDMNPVVYA